jgi:hypothetical protein
MAGVLALSGPAPLFGQSSSETVFQDLLERYSVILSDENKEKNAMAFYNVYSELQNMELKDLIETEVTNMSQEERDALETQGFGSTPSQVADSIYDIYSAFLEQFPNDVEDLQNGDDIFSKIYFEGSDLSSDDYSEFAPELKAMSLAIYKEFPSEFKAEVASWVEGTGNSESDVFEVFYNAIVDEKIGTKKFYNYRYNGVVDYTEVDLGLDTSVKTVMSDAILDVSNDSVSEETISDSVNAYYTMMNAILNAVEGQLGVEKVLVTAGQGNTNYDALSLLTEIDLLTTLSSYTEPKKDDNNDRPTGGGGGGGGTSPDPEPEDDDKTDNNDTVTVEDEKTPEAAVDVEKDYESENLEKAKEVAAGIENQTAEKAADAVAGIAKSLGEEIANNNLNAFEAAQVAEQVTEIAEAVLEKEDITAEQAKDVVKSTIESALAGAAEKDITGANRVELNNQAVALVEQAVKKAGEIKAEGQKLELTTESVGAALENAVATVTELKKTLVESGLTDAAAAVKPVISIEMDATVEEQVIELDATTLETLKESSAEVEINLGGMTFKMPAEMLEEFAASGLALESDIMSDEETAEVKEAEGSDGVDIDVVSDVYDIELKAGSDDAKFTAKPKLTIDVKSIVETLKVDAHKLSVFVFNEQSKAWDHVPTKIVDGVATFEPEHFSKYAVLKANVEFSDIEGHWAQETIEKMTANKITSGRTTEAFEPDAEITRAEFAAYLVNLLGLDGEIRGNFKDVPADAWYYDHVALAGINGLVSGVGEGNFAPDATISRQDMAVMMSKAYELMYGVEMTGNAAAFGDSILIADYAYDAVNASRYHKLVGGFEDGSFRPTKTATRAEAAQMLRVLWENN